MVGGGDLENMLVYDDIIGSSLDNFDDILDFSTEETHLLLDQSLAFPWQDLHSHSDQFPPLPTNDKAAPPPPNAAAYAGNDASESTGDFLCDDIDMAQLEWLSNFVEESFSPATIDLPKSVIDQNSMMGTNQNQVMIGGLDKKDHELQYRTPSPVSVLEHTGLINIGSSSSGSTSTYSSSSPTSSSCSGVVSGLKVLAPLSPPETLLVRGRAPRTKRSRPAAAFSRSNQFTTAAASEDVNDEASLFIPVPNSSEHENFAESVTAPAAEFRNVDHSKKKKKPKTFPSAMAEGDESGSGSDTAGGGATQVRKCMHCEITKTPQWRAGPMGPKTLCNACGVRYKSGRLFPEYRPAASPTFVATVHSNSHKKVVEMRNKTITKVEAAVPGPVSFKACELLNYIRGKSSSSRE